MKKCIYLLLIGIWISCQNKKEENKEIPIKELDNVIRLDKAYQNRSTVKLSELVDSISFIRLQTTDQSIFQPGSAIFYSPPYLISGTRVFDQEGNFLIKLGRQGQGAGEDPANPSSLTAYYENGYFYTQGWKIIQFDKQGRFTGKEFSIGAEAKSQEEYKQRALRWVNDYVAIDGTLILYDQPNNLIWLDEDFEIKDSYRLTPGDNPYFLHNYGTHPYLKNFTFYEDKKLFYNYFNDTVFSVTKNGVEPRWIIDLKERKLPLEYLEDYEELLDEYFLSFAKARGTNLSREEVTKESRLYQIGHDKIHIHAVYETSGFIFILWRYGIRGGENPMSMGYYNKQTGETVLLKDPGFEDDLLGMGYFLPKGGSWGDKLVHFMWPYELEEWMEEQKANGKKVHPRLVELSQQLDEEDNPFLIIADLKK